MCFKLLFTLLLCTTYSIAQFPIAGLEKRGELPKEPFIKVYPFHNGVQMIEIDYIGTWEHTTNYMDAMNPRGSSYRVDIGRPITNAYIFRNASGNVFKAYHTSETLDQLDARFSNYPIDTIVPPRTDTTFLDLEHLNLSNNQGFLYSSYVPPKNYGYYLIYDSTVNLPFNISFGFNSNSYNGLIGLIDSEGNEVISLTYNFIQLLPKGLIAVKNKRVGFLNYQLDTIVPFEYTSFETARYGLLNANYEFFFKKNDTIKLVCKPSANQFYEVNYDQIFWAGNDERGYTNVNFTVGIASIDYEYNFIDSNYLPISGKTYSYIDKVWKVGLIRVLKNQKWGIVNQKGEEVTQCQYDDIFIVNKDSVLAGIAGDYYWMTKDQVKLEVCEDTRLIDNLKRTTYHGNRYKELKVGGPKIYTAVKRVNDSVYVIQRNRQKWGVVDANGTLLSRGYYDKIFSPNSTYGNYILRNKHVRNPSNGAYEELHGSIDPSLKHFIPCQYQMLDSRAREGLITFRKDGKYGYMDSTGAIKIQAQYKFAQFFKEGLGRVGMDSTVGFINTSGEIVISTVYDGIYLPSDGLLVAQRNGKWGAMDIDEKIKIPFKYDVLQTFKGEIAAARLNNKWGLINRKGKVKIPFIYDDVDDVKFGNYIKVSINGKYGIVNLAGKEILPCIYNDIATWSYSYIKLSDEKIKVKKGTQWQWIKLRK